MNEKNYLNFHVIISHSPSCLNRDDMNMQKSAMFGGVRRVRISSQSLKRAWRKSDLFKSAVGDYIGKRTKRVGYEAARTNIGTNIGTLPILFITLLLWSAAFLWKKIAL